jgi:predicted AAA+ superfamily ATPase
MPSAVNCRPWNGCCRLRAKPWPSSSGRRFYPPTADPPTLQQSLPPWHSNRLKRLPKTPKLHFLDPGLLAALRDLSPEQVRADRTPFGALLETFIVAELLKLASWAGHRLTFAHFRDKDRNEVDIVAEDRRGRVVGIEVKAAATVTGADFGGLRRLAEACDERFALGLVLYDHDKVVPFGERLFAAPILTLWP